MPRTRHTERAYISFLLLHNENMKSNLEKILPIPLYAEISFVFSFSSSSGYMWASSIAEQYNPSFFSPRILSFMHCWKNVKLDFPYVEHVCRKLRDRKGGI